MRTQGHRRLLQLFIAQKLEVLSGLRPRLLTDVQKLPGARILDGQFTAVQQAIGHAEGRARPAPVPSRVRRGVKASAWWRRPISRNAVQASRSAPARSALARP